MKIVVEVPDVKCSRCDAAEALQPTVLQLAAHARPIADACSAVDERGNAWTGKANLPDGWSLSDGRHLCKSCTESLQGLLSSFMDGGSLAVIPEGPVEEPVRIGQPSPIRYIERPPTSSIPMSSEVASPRREFGSNIIRAQPTTVRSTPPPANARSVISNASMAVNTSKISSNVVPAAKVERPPQPNMILKGLTQTISTATAPVKPELVQQPPPKIEIGEGDPIPSPAVPEPVKVVSRS